MTEEKQEPFTNARPMPNQRRARSWLGGAGCALIWLITPVICVLSISGIELLPVEYRQLVIENVKAIPIFAWLVLIGLIVTGFVAGRDFINWLYKE